MAAKLDWLRWLRLRVGSGADGANWKKYVG